MKDNIERLKAMLRFKEGESKKLGFMLIAERNECKKLKNKLKAIDLILDLSLIEAKEKYNSLTRFDGYRKSAYHQGQIDALNEIKGNLERIMMEEAIVDEKGD